MPAAKALPRIFLLTDRPLELDNGARALLNETARANLAELLPLLGAASEWSVPALETAVKSFTAAKHLKLGQVAQPLRAALTGKSTSPGIFEVLVALGREESLARIGDQASSNISH